jgi:peptidoglycan/xylan/chitin deacetylase (PgdA/CDA1 family)
MNILTNTTRSLLRIWLVSIILTGCATKHFAPPPKPTHFIRIIPKQGQSLFDIAKEYLSDSNLSFRISEFNNMDFPSIGKPLVIPLKPMYPYGIRENGLQTIPILSYHSFSWKTSDKMTIRKEDFEAQMNYLKVNGYKVVPLSRVLNLFNGKELPKKSVVITIDDGWGSTYRIAYPVLRKYGYPFTLFVQTDLINKAYKTLDWPKIREMMKTSNITVGCHTKAHRDLSQPKPGESYKKYYASIKRELSAAKRIIFRETGTDPIHLAYPYGRTNQLVVDLAKEVGYSTAYTINRGGNSILTNPLKLNRSMIYGTYNLEKFASQLNTFENFDIINNIADISLLLNQPSESTAQILEDKKLWRSALNHWRLIRDSLLQQSGDEYLQFYAQEPSVKKGKPSYYSGNIKKRIEMTEQKINQIETRVHEIANDHYNKGINEFKARNPTKGIKELLKALYFDPEFTEAKNLLSLEVNTPDYLTVSIKKGDTPTTIAKRIYKDSKKSFLVSKYAEMQGGLIPGSILNLPDIPKQKMILVTSPKQYVIKKHKNQCGIKLNRSKSKLAKDFFTQGELFFNEDQIGKAIISLKTSICLDPNNSAATELLHLLKSLKN